PLPSLGKRARIAPLLLDMELAGAITFAPPTARGKGEDEGAELARATLQSILSAHYRAHLASQMQLASTEQSYEDLERQNAELREAYERLKTLDRLKGDFVANVNHELRTPLTAVLGFTELLELDTSNLTQEQIESLRQIHDKTNQLIKIVGRVLAFTDTGGERPRLGYSRFALPELIREIVQQHGCLASERRITIDFREGEAVPRIEADREKIAAVIDNLIENGIKFSPEGATLEIILETSKETGVADDPFLAMADSGASEVFLHVIDHGPGFSPTQVQQIFADFHQLDSSSTRQFGGLGLGLALARRIVELHGGKILVDSAPGEGAHFVVRLPVGPSADFRSGPRKRILVVEDEAFVVRLVGAFLEERGYEVLSANSAGEAERMVHSQPIDLLLLDMRLPDRLGVELLEEFRLDELAHRIPAIVITALPDEALHQRARRAGALDVILKPFTREHLLDVVNNALGQQSESFLPPPG
ncbi:MAG: ATP-binding protein, partial [Bdellovibrionota bacterium]